MKKVCAVISSLELGGAELTFLTLVQSMASWGWHVHIVTLLPGTPIPTDLPSSVTFECLELTTRNTSLFGKIQIVPKIIAALSSVFEEKPPDLVVSFMTQTNLFTLCALPSRAGVSCVVAERVHPEFAPILMSGLVKPCMRMLRNYLYAKASIITVQSDTMHQFFPPRLRSRIRTIPNSIRAFSFMHSERKREKILLTIGRLMPQKDQATLIRAFSALPSAVKDWQLVIVGSGPLENELKHLSASLGKSDHITFIPKTEQIEDMYASASIFALTSKYEGFPNVILEAMSFELPVVATDAPGATQDLIHDGDNGYLVPIGEVEEISDALMKLMSSQARREEFGAANKKYATKYESDLVMKEWRRILENCS